MNELEQTRRVIEDKHYYDIFNSINGYLRENPEEICYEGDCGILRWCKLYLCNYKIIELYYVMNQGTKFVEIVVDANIRIFGWEDIVLDRNISVKLHIGASVASDLANIKVVYVGRRFNDNRFLMMH